jgi:hypothetical protein
MLTSYSVHSRALAIGSIPSGITGGLETLEKPSQYLKDNVARLNKSAVVIRTEVTQTVPQLYGHLTAMAQRPEQRKKR